MVTIGQSRTASLGFLVIFLVFFLCLMSRSHSDVPKSKLYEVQWHRLVSKDTGQTYMRGKLSTPLALHELEDWPMVSEPGSSSPERMGLAVNLLEESLASLEICAKSRSWWTENTVKTVDFRGRHKTGTSIPAAIEPSCSYFIDRHSTKHPFIPEETSSWPGALDLVIFELAPFEPASAALPLYDKSADNWLATSSGAGGSPFWHDPKWRFYPGGMAQSLGAIEILPLLTNPFARLFFHPDSFSSSASEVLLIHFINPDGSSARRIITQSEFSDLTGILPVDHPDFWKILANSEISVKASEETDIITLCGLSHQLSAEMTFLAGKFLQNSVQSPVPDEQGQSAGQVQANSGDQGNGGRQGSPNSPLRPSSAENQGSKGGAGGEKQPPEEPGLFAAVFSDSDQLFVDMLVNAARAGDPKQVESLVHEHGVQLLFGLHCLTGESALHAAIKADQEPVILKIMDLSGDDGYSRLLQLPNRMKQTPLDLFKLFEELSQREQAVAMETTDQHMPRTSSEAVEPVNHPISVSQPSSCTFHPFVKQAEALDPEDQQIKEYFGKYDQDLQRYRDSDIQYASEGRVECAVHPGFWHAETRLPCCGAYICQPTVIVLARMMISGLIRKNDERVNCPACERQLDLVTALNTMKAVAEGRVVHLSKSSASEGYMVLQGGEKFTLKSEPYLIRSSREIKDFVDDILSILYEHVDIKKKFEQKVIFLKNTECEICLEAQNCIQLSREEECAHRFCRDCLKEYLKQSAVDLNALSQGILTCPGTDCPVQIPDYVVQVLTGKKILERLHNSQLKLAAKKNKTLFICLTPSCDNVMDIGEACSPKVFCNSCRQTSCSQCLVTPFHEGWSCKVYQTALTKDGSQAMFEAFKKREAHKIKNCPVCNTEIYKEMGCNLMHCSSCQEAFCWECLQVITGSGYKHFREGKCKLQDSAGAQHNAHALEDPGEVRQREIRPHCQRCFTENMIEQWLCGHYFCTKCQEHLFSEAAENDLNFDELCIVCFGQKPEATANQRHNGGHDPLPQVAEPQVAGRLLSPQVVGRFGRFLRPQVAGHIPRPQVAGHILRPQVAGHILRPQVAGHILRPQVAGHILRPQVAGHILRPQVVGHTLRPQVAGHILRPQVVGHTLRPQVAGHILRPQEYPKALAGDKPAAEGLWNEKTCWCCYQRFRVRDTTDICERCLSRMVRMAEQLDTP